jgi:hypothetical protein
MLRVMERNFPSPSFPVGGWVIEGQKDEERRERHTNSDLDR